MIKRQIEYLVIVGASVGAVLGYQLLRGWLIRRNLRRLAASRDSAHCRGEFFAYCSEKGIPADATEQMYRYLQRDVCVEDFPIRLDDALYKGLRLSKDEIDTTAEDLAVICERKAQWDLDASPKEEPTVRDLLNLISGWR